jgi:hypothetical protein
LDREVATIVDEYRDAGVYEIEFNLEQIKSLLNISSGIYFYRIQAGKYFDTKKMIIMR